MTHLIASDVASRNCKTRPSLAIQDHLSADSVSKSNVKHFKLHSQKTSAFKSGVISVATTNIECRERMNIYVQKILPTLCPTPCDKLDALASGPLT